MTYNHRLAAIFEHRVAARKPRPRAVAMTNARRPLRSAMRLLVVLAAAPLLIALRLGDSGGSTAEWPLADFPEPSGIVWHPQRASLFLVGDEGDIGEVSLDGKLLRKSHFGGDLEAITVDPSTGRLYIVRESHEVIFEIHPDDFRILRRFTIDRGWKGDPNYLRRGGDGVEGITFVPDAADPEGGRFWVVNQYDPPVIAELELPLRSAGTKYETARIRRAIPVDSAPLSDVAWDPKAGRFLVVSALWKSVSVLDAGGNYERSVHIPGFMTEGLALLPDGRIAIAQDSGGVVLWSPAGNPFLGDPATGPPAPARGGAGDVPKTGSAPAVPAKSAPPGPGASKGTDRGRAVVTGRELV